MYLFFDKTGVLKEIINDEALRQGNYGVNQMNIYLEGHDLWEGADISYLLPDNTIVPVDNFSTFQTKQIPFNRLRDLRFFKYYTNYRFLVVDLEAPDDTENDDVVGPGPLDQAGVVHCSASAILSGGNQLQLGDINFCVEENPYLNLKYVVSEEYLSLSNYQYLRKLIQQIQTNYASLSGDNTFTGEITFTGQVHLPANSVSYLQIQDGSIRRSKLAENLNTNIALSITTQGVSAPYKNSEFASDQSSLSLSISGVRDTYLFKTDGTTFPIIALQVGDIVITKESNCYNRILSQKTFNLGLYTLVFDVLSGPVLDETITTAKVANSAVTNSKIATGAVSETKIDAFAVSTGKIQNGAITTDKLGALAVTNSKMANGTVTKEKLNLYTYDIGSALAGATLETLDDVLNWFQVEIIDNLLATELFLTCYRINTSGGEYEFESCSFTYDTANSEVSFVYDHGGSPVRIICDNDMTVAQFLQDVQGIYIVTLG